MAVTPSRIEIIEGESAVLSASVSPEAASDRAVAWSSSDRSVATVDKAGTVHGLRPGTATVTATAEGKSGTCAVTVKAKAVNVTDVSLDRTELTLTEGETETLTATVKPDNADNRKVTWSSDKTEIATVDGAGKVTAVKAGEAVVTVMTEDGGKTASCKVTVKAKEVPVTGVDVKPWSVTIGANGTTKLTCTVAPSNATNRNVRWESDNPSVATVDSDGNVRAVSAGVAKVSAVTEDGGFRSGCTVTVKEFSSGFEVGGLFYKTAKGYSMDFVEVTGNPGGGKYSGDVVVPGTVEYDGITYTVKGVGNRAFEGCDDLRKVTISEGIYKIGAYAFYYSGNLERVILPSTLENIDDSNPVFEACSKLEIITTAPREGQENYCYLYDKALYMHVGRTEREILSWIPEKKTGTVVIKEGTTKIGYSSIRRTNVDKIVIPESVKSIDIYGEMHRYIPMLAQGAGFSKIGEKVVQHRARKYGHTKFGLERFVNGMLDMISIVVLRRFGRRPMHFFGLVGFLMFTVGFFSAAYIGINKLYMLAAGQKAILVTDNPWFYIMLTMMILGVQFFMAGFIGEMIVKNRSHMPDFNLDREIGPATDKTHGETKQK